MDARNSDIKILEGDHVPDDYISTVATLKQKPYDWSIVTEGLPTDTFRH